MRERVLESEYKDADALVELARLQLLRDSETGFQGHTDLVAGGRDAKRAVAVDPSPRSRLVLALAEERRFLASRDRSAAATAVLFEVLEQFLPLDAPAGPAGAWARALAGYHRLAVGHTDEAEASLREASRMDPTVALAWRGLGDLARSRGQWEDAAEAYRAALRVSDDPAARSGLELAEQRASFALPEPGPELALPVVAADSPPGVPLVPCGPQGRSRPEGEAFCDALDGLIAAESADERGKAATAVVGAYGPLRDLCRAGEAVCGTHVAPALLASAHTFARPHVGRAVMTARFVLQDLGFLPNAGLLKGDLLLFLAGQTFAIGEFAQAQRYYVSSIDLAGRRAGGAAETVLALAVVLGNAASSDVHRVLAGEYLDEEQRRRWSALIDPESAAGERVERTCSPVLVCAHWAVLQSPSWSPAAERGPSPRGGASGAKGNGSAPSP